MIKRLNESGRNEIVNKGIMENAFKALYECLDNGYSEYYCDIHSEVFNSDDYLSYYYDNNSALNVLEQYGIFTAIKEIVDYEKDMFGEVYHSDVSFYTDPWNVMGLLWYLKGEEVISEMYKIDAFNDNWDDEATPELNEEIMQGMIDLGYVKQ